MGVPGGLPKNDDTFFRAVPSTTNHAGSPPAAGPEPTAAPGKADIADFGSRHFLRDGR
jgi:hypothetical protein